MNVGEQSLSTRQCIGYFSPYLPPEIVWACGMTPVRLRPGTSQAAAEGFLPRNFSVEARALLASALDGNFSTSSGQALAIEAAIFLDEDDTSRRFFDVWRASVDIPALGLVALPRLNNDLACQRYADALTELAASLGTISGQSLTMGGLRRAVGLYNEQRALLRDFRQRWIDGGLSAGDWYDLRWLALTTDPVSANAELTASLGQMPLPARPPGGGPRLFVLSGMHVPRQFLTFLETCGARVVAEDSEADERTLTEPVSLALDSGQMDFHIRGLAAAYLNKPSSPRPNALLRRLASITQLLNTRQVQGVIAMYPKFADSYLAEYIGLSELFRERGLPALLLEDDGESGFSGQQRTRIEAFLEVLA